MPGLSTGMAEPQREPNTAAGFRPEALATVLPFELLLSGKKSKKSRRKYLIAKKILRFLCHRDSPPKATLSPPALSDMQAETPALTAKSPVNLCGLMD